MSDNVVDLHDLRHSASKKLTPGELSEIEEVRMVPMTKAQSDIITELGKGLCKIGVTQNGTMLVAFGQSWKVARR
jgi:hypothetical protein